MDKLVFNGIVSICQTHAERLNWALTKLAGKRPIDVQTIQNLTDMDLAIFDQLIVRFSKLQDVMGAKLLPAVLALTHEEGDLSTFINKLNRLEKIGAIESVDQWLKLRELRNQFSHDYPDEPEIQASLLNKSFAMSEQLLASLKLLISFSAQYIDA